MKWVAALLMFSVGTALADDEHHHPPQDSALHTKFYNSWYMPNGGNERVHSCCNDRDCYPTAIKLVGGTYFFRRREDGQWSAIPNGKLEHLQPDPRESPDGQSHVCANPYGFVFCAALGDGI